MGGGVEGDAAEKAQSDCASAPLSLLLGQGASPLQPI